MIEIQILILIILIVFSAFFSGVETALMSLNMVKVKALLRQNRKGSSALYHIKQNPQRLIITILIGNNLVNISAAVLATVLFTNMFGSNGVGIATGVMTFLILVFGEIVPKTFATQNAERVSLVVATPIDLLSRLLSPVVKFLELIARGMSKVLGSKEEKQLSEEELKTIVTMGKEEGILSKEAAEMMHNVLEFEGTKVTKIMIPKSDMDMVNGNSRLKDVINFVVKQSYSKYPVYLKDTDKIIGVLDVDDVLRYVKNKQVDVNVKALARPILIVPEYMEIDDLLSDFEGKKIPMAIVVDEYENVLGLVTIEDILEEIVGDIFDKGRSESRYIRKINDKLIRADAKASVVEINKVLKLDIDERHFNTLAGFIEHRLQRIPEKGEKIKLKNLIIEIDEVTNHGIKSVKIIKS